MTRPTGTIDAERAELALMGSDAAVWDWDVKTGALWWSASMKATIGLPEDVEPDYQLFLDRLHPDDHERVLAAVTASLDERAPYRLAFRLRRSDGGYSTVRSTGHVVRDAGGAPVRMVGVQIDISREIAMERKAHEAREFSAVALDAPAWRWDGETGLFTLDACFAALLERPELEGVPLTREDVLSAVHPDDRAFAEQELETVFVHRSHAFARDHRLMLPSGEVVWVRAHAGLIERPGGGPPVAAGVVVDRTAAKRTELALSEAKERYDLAVNGSRIAIWDWDVGAGELVWSDEFRRILGLSLTDLSGKVEEFTGRLHPEDRPRVEAALASHVEAGSRYDITFRMRHAGGWWVPVHARGDSVRDASGRAVRMAGSVLDITATREAERAAAEALTKIALAAKHAGICPVEVDLGAGKMRGDDSLALLIGEPDLREIDLDHALAIVHPDDLEAVETRLGLVYAGEDRFESEHRVVRPDGGIIWTQTVAMVTRRDETGAPLILSGVVIDHTARRSVERDLAEAKERYDLAVGASHMAIWDQNLLTGEVYWSARFGEILGLDPVARVESAQAFTARLHPDDRQQARCAFHALLNEDVPYDLHLRMRHADGGYVPVRSRCGVVRDEDGAPVRVCGSLTDVSAEMMARARADLAVEAARLGITDWDLVSGTITADARFSEFLGRPWLANRPGPATTTARYTHEDDLDGLMALLGDLEAGRSSRVEFEHRVIQPGGTIVWLGGNASVIDVGADGRPRRILGVFEDRTARKAAEMQLSRAKQRYDLAVSGALTAIFDQNLETGELYWSARLGEMLGLGAAERTEPIGDFLERVNPDDRARTKARIGIAIETGAPLDMTLRARRTDGAYRHLRLRAGVLRNDAGRPARLCGSVTDVTDEMEAEAKARLAGRRAQLALEAAHLGVWEFDVKTETTVVDATLADLAGVPEIAGKPMSRAEMLKFDHPDDAARLRRDFARIRAGEIDTARNEYRLIRADGTEIWVRSDVGVAERAPDGSVTRQIGIVQDLSVVKRTEKLLRESANAARRANEAKSQFLATMSHEIRTPLNGVLGVVQLLERTELDSRQRRYVETIKASGRSLSEIIEDVLDISRIEAGKLQLRLEPALVGELLDQAAAPSRALAAEKGVDLSLTVHADLSGPILVDPRRVAQMTANLIGNAVKFTETGGVRVTARRPDQGLLRIEVEDDGPGLPEEMHEAVFDRFSQADMSPSRAHEGSGLGLAIVRELAKLSGGVAGVRSRPGEGACFSIEIPAPAVGPGLIKDGADALAGAAKSVGARLTMPQRSLRVLVVEDHPVNRAVTAELVTQAGHACETADTGEEALSALKARPVDVVLLDLHMPGMDGKAVLARLRRGEAGAADTPVYMVSADATPEAKAETLALGANGYFVKPLDADALRRTLSQVSPQAREAG